MKSARCWAANGSPRCSAAPEMFSRQPQSPGDHARRARALNVVELVVHQSAGDGRVLDGEGAAESAALALAGELDQFDVLQLAQQVLGVLDDTHLAQGVAGGVPGHAQGLTPVFITHAEHPHHELGPLEHAPRKGLGLRQILVSGKERGVVVLHHAGAGSRRHYDRDVLAERLDLPSGHGPGFVREARVVSRLAAAGLSGGENHPHAFALDQAHRRQARVGIKCIDQAGAEEIRSRGF